MRLNTVCPNVLKEAVLDFDATTACRSHPGRVCWRPGAGEVLELSLSRVAQSPPHPKAAMLWHDQRVYPESYLQGQPGKHGRFLLGSARRVRKPADVDGRLRGSIPRLVEVVVTSPARLLLNLPKAILSPANHPWIVHGDVASSNNSLPVCR